MPTTLAEEVSQGTRTIMTGIIPVHHDARPCTRTLADSQQLILPTGSHCIPKALARPSTGSLEAVAAPLPAPSTMCRWYGRASSATDTVCRTRRHGYDLCAGRPQAAHVPRSRRTRYGAQTLLPAHRRSHRRASCGSCRRGSLAGRGSGSAILDSRPACRRARSFLRRADRSSRLSFLSFGVLFIVRSVVKPLAYPSMLSPLQLLILALDADIAGRTHG